MCAWILFLSNDNERGAKFLVAGNMLSAFFTSVCSCLSQAWCLRDTWLWLVQLLNEGFDVVYAYCGHLKLVNFAKFI